MPYFPERHLTKTNGEWVDDSGDYSLETLDLQSGGLQRTITTVKDGVETQWNRTEISTRVALYTSVDGTEQLRWLQFDRFHCLDDRQKGIDDARKHMGTGIGLSVALVIAAFFFMVVMVQDEEQGTENSDHKGLGCLINTALSILILAVVLVARSDTNSANEGVADTEWEDEEQFEEPANSAIGATGVALAAVVFMGVFASCCGWEDNFSSDSCCCLGVVFLLAGFVCVITTSVAFHRIGDTPWAPDLAEVNLRQNQCGSGDECYPHQYWCKWNNVELETESEENL
jgi:hypothetical protein